MKPEDALTIIGDWIADETAKRKYHQSEIIDLADALVNLKSHFKPMEPRRTVTRYGTSTKCPACTAELDWAYEHCPHCGKKLDWKEPK